MNLLFSFKTPRDKGHLISLKSFAISMGIQILLLILMNVVSPHLNDYTHILISLLSLAPFLAYSLILFKSEKRRLYLNIASLFSVFIYSVYLIYQASIFNITSSFIIDYISVVLTLTIILFCFNRDDLIVKWNYLFLILLAILKFISLLLFFHLIIFDEAIIVLFKLVLITFSLFSLISYIGFYYIVRAYN